jgi:simple sugar transport system permease protein
MSENIPVEKPSLREPRPSFFKKPGTVSFNASLICILFGFVIGFILLICINAQNAAPAFGELIIGGFSSRDAANNITWNVEGITNVLYASAPIMCTGLAVAFAFKAGSFNIGGSGQYLAGGLMALLGALLWKLPWYVDLILALVGGAVWGAIPGILKAYLNINEVLSAIMLNWIALIIGFVIIKNIPAMINPVYQTKTATVSTVNPSGVIPSWGLENFSSNLTISVFIAILFAFVIWVILSKTTLGFEIKACGLNKDAAKYAGIAEKRNIIVAFAISGALAGLGGALYYLAPTSEAGFTLQTSTLPSAGFDGISVALLAANNPIGCIFSALLVSYLNVAGEKMQSYGFAPEIVTVTIGVIVYFASFAVFVRGLLAKEKKKQKAAVSLANQTPLPVTKEEVKPAAEKPTMAPVTPTEEKKTEAAPQEVKKETEVPQEAKPAETKPVEDEGPVSDSPIKEDKKLTKEEEAAFIKEVALRDAPSNAEPVATADGENMDNPDSAKPAMEVSTPAVSHDFVIPTSPFMRNIDGYQADNPANEDIVPLDREGEALEPPEAEQKAEDARKGK